MSLPPCFGKEYNLGHYECSVECPHHGKCRIKFYETSVVDLAKGYSMSSTVTGRMSSAKENMANYPRNADGSSDFIFCQHAPPREALESLGLVWSYSLKAAFERHQTWINERFKERHFNYGRDIPPGVYTCVPTCEVGEAAAAIILLQPWMGHLHLFESLPGRAQWARCQLCGGWAVMREIKPKVEWPRPDHLFTSTALVKRGRQIGATEILQRHIPNLKKVPREVIIDSLAAMQDPDREPGDDRIIRTNGCESRFAHICGGAMSLVGFRSRDGHLSSKSKRYRFCNTAIEMHRERGNRVEVITSEEPDLRDRDLAKYIYRPSVEQEARDKKLAAQKLNDEFMKKVEQVMRLPPDKIHLHEEVKGSLSFVVDRLINGGGIRFQAWRRVEGGLNLLCEEAITDAELLIPNDPQADIQKRYARFVDDANRQYDLQRSMEFGLAYGSTPKQLATQLNLSVEEIAEYQARFFKAHPQVEAYIAKAKEGAEKMKFHFDFGDLERRVFSRLGMLPKPDRPRTVHDLEVLQQNLFEAMGHPRLNPESSDEDLARLPPEAGATFRVVKTIINSIRGADGPLTASEIDDHFHYAKKTRAEVVDTILQHNGKMREKREFGEPAIKPLIQGQMEQWLKESDEHRQRLLNQFKIPKEFFNLHDLMTLK